MKTVWDMKADNLPVFMAVWMLLRQQFTCTLESELPSSLIIYVDGDKEDGKAISTIMKRCADDTLKLDWCDGNWTITTA